MNTINEDTYATINVPPKISTEQNITILPTNNNGTEKTDLFKSMAENEYVNANMEQIDMMIEDLANRNVISHDQLYRPNEVTKQQQEAQPTTGSGYHTAQMPVFDRWWSQILMHLQKWQHQLFFDSLYKILRDVLKKNIPEDDHKQKILEQLVWLNKADQSILKSSSVTLKSELEKYIPLPRQFEDELIVYNESIKTFTKRAEDLLQTFEQDIQHLINIAIRFRQEPSNRANMLSSQEHQEFSFINNIQKDDNSRHEQYYVALINMLKLLVQCFRHLQTCREKYFAQFDKFITHGRNKNKNIVSTLTVIQNQLKKQVKNQEK